jgi:hypothetical protein
MLQNFVRAVVRDKKSEPWTRPVYSPRAEIVPRPKPRPLPKTLDAITVGRDSDWTDVDGLLGEIRDWITTTAPFPNKPLATMARMRRCQRRAAGGYIRPPG